MVEPSGQFEPKDKPVRGSRGTQSPSMDKGNHKVSAEGDKLSNPLNSHCLKVTFNPERLTSSSYKDEFRRNRLSTLPKQIPTNTAPSKDDVLSVVIQKLTELVNDSENLKNSATVQSGFSSGRSTPSGGCCTSSRRAVSPKQSDPLYKCQNCPCLFAVSAKQLHSKEKALCECCEKSPQTTQCQTGNSEEHRVERQVTPGFSTDKELSKIKCELCSHIADCYVDLLYHLSEHADAKIFKCKLCDFFTTIKARILEHSSIHNAPHVYKCSNCPFVTGKLAILQGHMKNHNRDNELLLKCSECGFSCRCEDALRNHMWEHVPSTFDTTRRTPTPNPKELVPVSRPIRRGSDECRTPLVPSQALPSQTTAGDQSYIFKCLLCGYLCDRLATLKAHAWRHAGETGCSYPVVDENTSLKQSLSNSQKTDFPSVTKPLPVETVDKTKFSSKAEMSKDSLCCDVMSIKDSEGRWEVPSGETSRISCGCSSVPNNKPDEVPSCRCEGINIPPSSLPHIKELLIQKKKDNSHDNEALEKTLDNHQESVPTLDKAYLHKPCHRNSSETDEYQQNDNPVSLPVSGGNLGAGYHASESSQRDPHVLLIHPVDPQLLFIDLDMPIPEPAAMVEAITEQNPAKTPEHSESEPSPSPSPSPYRITGEASVDRERPHSLPMEDSSSSETISNIFTEIQSQCTLNDPDTVPEPETTLPHKKSRENLTKLPTVDGRGRVKVQVNNFQNTDTDKNLKTRSGLSDFVTSVQTSSQFEVGPCNTNRGRMPVIAGEAFTAEEHVDAAHSMIALTSQENQAEIVNTVSSISSPLEKGVTEKLSVLTRESYLSPARSKLLQTIDVERVSCKKLPLPIQEACIALQVEIENVIERVPPITSELNIENEEDILKIPKRSEFIQEEQMNNNTENASAFKRKILISETMGSDSLKGAKRPCKCEKSPHYEKDISQPNTNTQSVIEGQEKSSGEPEGVLEETFIPLDMFSEEDSVVKFFMNIIEDSSVPFQCKLCSKNYESYDSLKRHLQTHLVHNSFRCPLCKDCFESLDSLKFHIQEHYEESYSCSGCSAFFYNKSDLHAHYRESHTALKEFTCDLCNMTISGQAEYVGHRETVHSEKSLVRCTHCGEQFSNTNMLLLHTLSCSLRKMRCCKECNFSAETAQSLQDHVRDSHLRAKFYKCTLCDYKSSAKNGIKNHMKFHATERPYKCQLCSFMGAYPQSLRSHMRMHNQPDWRPDCLPSELPEQYMCKLCCYTCNYLPSLKSHMWRHASDPNYSYKGDQDSGTDMPTVDSSSAQAMAEASQQQGTSTQSNQATQSLQQGSEVKCNVVTFCCQECGLQSTDRDILVDHLKTHLPQEMIDADKHSKEEIKK